MKTAKKIGVLIVDEAPLSKNLLSQIVEDQADMHIVGHAANLPLAREIVRPAQPDVLLLDISSVTDPYPVEKFLHRYSLPAVLVSTQPQVELGPSWKGMLTGQPFVQKPDLPHAMPAFAAKIADKLRLAAANPRPTPAKLNVAPSFSAECILPFNPTPPASHEKLIIVGASTGGTEAIRDFLVELPTHSPAVLIAQHMPEAFTKSFADRLDNLCKIRVKEAAEGERILPGHAYIAPGHSHLLLKRIGSNYFTELNHGMPVNRHRPSVDVLFRSAANYAGKNAIGVILTGMGKDGAQGMLEMKQTGAHTFAQDEASCVVFGMPKEAIGLGGVDEVVPLKEMAVRVLRLLA